MRREGWSNSVQVFGCPHYKEGGQGSENKEFESTYILYDDNAKLANMAALISWKSQANSEDSSIYLGGTVGGGRLCSARDYCGAD